MLCVNDKPLDAIVHHQAIDALESAMIDKLELVDPPVTHRFVPGMYCREIFMKAGTLIVSKIHLTEHIYVVTKGRVSVYIPDVGVQEISAPYTGITKPGTRRVLCIHEDTTWLTFHPTVEGETCEADLGKIEARIIDPRPDEEGLTANQRYRMAMAQHRLEAS